MAETIQRWIKAARSAGLDNRSIAQRLGARGYTKQQIDLLLKEGRQPKPHTLIGKIVYQIAYVVHVLLGLVAVGLTIGTSFNFLYIGLVVIVTVAALLVAQKLRASTSIIVLILLVTGFGYLATTIPGLLTMRTYTELNVTERKLCRPMIGTNIVTVYRITTGGQQLYKKFTDQQHVTDVSSYHYYNAEGEELCWYNGFAGDTDGCEAMIQSAYPGFSFRNVGEQEMMCSNHRSGE